MKQITVYQYDLAGRFLGPTLADESPMEPGVFLMPARTVAIEPPQCMDGAWPRWNGSAWEMSGAGEPRQLSQESPLDKLQAFLQANPDVAALIL